MYRCFLSKKKTKSRHVDVERETERERDLLGTISITGLAARETASVLSGVLSVFSDVFSGVLSGRSHRTEDRSHSTM